MPYIQSDDTTTIVQYHHLISTSFEEENNRIVIYNYLNIKNRKIKYIKRKFLLKSLNENKKTPKRLARASMPLQKSCKCNGDINDITLQTF